MDFHPNAMPAAKAAYCTGQDDPKLFWKLHDWIFANQDKWASAQDAAEQFRTQAQALGVDVTKYDACISSSETVAAIDRDIQEGAGMGVSGTPAFFVNDWFISGAYPFEEFQKTIEKAQQGVHPPPTPTPLPEGAAPYDADPARPGLTYDGSPTQGDSKSRLVLVAFEDFKCSYCLKHFQEVEPALKAKYIDTGQMREVFKFFPIFAPKAAVASLCAAQQGKFWEFHDVLFGKQAEWQDGDDAAMIAYAEGIGLDKDKFSRCLADASVQAQVDADAELSQQLGLNGTPSFLLIDTQAGTGTRIPGALSLEQFEQAIQSLLNPATPTPTPTPAP